MRFRIDGILYEPSAPLPRRCSGEHRLAHQDHGRPEHRREAPAPGRPHPDQDRRAATSTCASRPCRSRTASASCCGCCRAPASCSTSRSSASTSDHLRDLRQADRARRNGIILVTGPTGSGKTTTLYAALSRDQHAPTQNIITIEDPVEIQLPGISQIQVNPKIGLTFASGLRSILRQDPDVILVGEIRDLETAEIAIQAALTGHLVFSTLHTNDAPSAITRLVDMGVEPFLVASSLVAVLAQRLVRVLCTRLPRGLRRRRAEELGRDRAAQRRAAGRRIYRAEGCARCNHTGYRGRSDLRADADRRRRSAR